MVNGDVAHGGGLIALTGGPDGPIDKALREGQKEVACERLKVLEKIFGDRLYVEIQRHGLRYEIECEPMASRSMTGPMSVAKSRGSPISSACTAPTSISIMNPG